MVTELDFHNCAGFNFRSLPLPDRGGFGYPPLLSRPTP